ncbi:MAG: D-2-hydroxyacid dehydrogenase [Atopobiaceae bacterium]|jgi:phosphoglycerate dehydrogenase-like enzyme|nr:D-2-hydroxyacid dehydrogenase [Atopobiaceae bacterium]MCH4119980.1 D-2-hydroxyacid dehydrogenase [Atopobiaceae bacterium]MCI1389339.1 D-2-hydroxyacid dehydrogenase [Atopobiaceae bacterium]MCI1432402.1 D-2-hydroxyacid dehydrogenase [Atopobiaceae bacterium]MCI1470860.1 D-2-hydroxyacid dehydrogenase [Atopobiaceae bacterium]
MATSSALPKLAVIASEEAGIPDLSALEGSFELAVCLDASPEEALDGAVAAFVWDVSRADEVRGAWDKAASLRWMHVAVTGVDGFCFPELLASDVTLTNAAGIYDVPIGEYVLAACLGYERRAKRLMAQQAAHEWKWLMGSTLAGKNALVLGPGHIGRRCGRLLRAVGANVGGIGTHRHEPDEVFDFVESVSELPERIGWADHIVITLPLTEGTRGLVGFSVLARCKPSAHLVNVGRGPIVDTAALVEALASGRLGGATLDVVAEEPLREDSLLWDMDDVVITPHLAGDVDGFEDSLVQQFVDNALRFVRGERLMNVVDKRVGY